LVELPESLCKRHLVEPCELLVRSRDLVQVRLVKLLRRIGVELLVEVLDELLVELVLWIDVELLVEVLDELLSSFPVKLLLVLLVLSVELPVELLVSSRTDWVGRTASSRTSRLLSGCW